MKLWPVVVMGLFALARPVAAKAPPVKAPPETKAIAAVIEAQLAGFRDTATGSAIYAPNAMIAMTGGTSTPQVNKLTHSDGKWTIFGPATVGKHTVQNLRVAVARDGKTAWASFIARVKVDGLASAGDTSYRVSELFVSTPAGWQVTAAAWSLGVAKATLAKAAKSGRAKALETVFDQDLGDKDVIAAAKALGSSPLDPKAVRGDVVAIGTGAGEVTAGATAVTNTFHRDWENQLGVHGAVWALTAGSTACVTANVELSRAGGIVPARLFAVFEKTDGAWTPVLLHLAAAP